MRKKNILQTEGRSNFIFLIWFDACTRRRRHFNNLIISSYVCISWKKNMSRSFILCRGTGKKLRIRFFRSFAHSLGRSVGRRVSIWTPPKLANCIFISYGPAHTHTACNAHTHTHTLDEMRWSSLSSCRAHKKTFAQYTIGQMQNAITVVKPCTELWKKKREGAEVARFFMGTLRHNRYVLLMNVKRKLFIECSLEIKW